MGFFTNLVLEKTTLNSGFRLERQADFPPSKSDLMNLANATLIFHSTIMRSILSFVSLQSNIMFDSLYAAELMVVRAEGNGDFLLLCLRALVSRRFNIVFLDDFGSIASVKGNIGLDKRWTTDETCWWQPLRWQWQVDDRDRGQLVSNLFNELKVDGPCCVCGTFNWRWRSLTIAQSFENVLKLRFSFMVKWR